MAYNVINGVIGFPRSRGDEPRIPLGEIDKYMFSPLTRG